MLRMGPASCRAPCRVATKLCRVVPNIGEYSGWNLLRVTLLAPRILRWFIDFQRICSPLS